VRSCETLQDVPLTVHLAGPSDDDLFITAAVTAAGGGAGETARRFYERLASRAKAQRMHVVHERVFGSLSVRADVLAARRDALGRQGIDPDGPLTYVQGRPVWGDGLAGVQLRLVRPPESSVEVIREGGVPCGRAWTRSGARFLILQDMSAEAPCIAGQTRGEQAARMFQRTQAILAAEGADYTHVVRTWIYLSRLLEWYDEFNGVRNRIYGGLGLADERGPRLPASTGIEGDNAHGAACMMDVVAVVPLEGSAVRTSFLGNVRQADAFSYGSAFSRGASIREPHLEQVHISGTAAVDRQGRTMHVGDVRGQILSAAESVRSLIGQEGVSLDDICQATLFFKDGDGHGVFRALGAESGLADVPAVVVRADVCRDDWLFEVDGIAARARTP